MYAFSTDQAEPILRKNVLPKERKFDKRLPMSTTENEDGYHREPP